MSAGTYEGTPCRHGHTTRYVRNKSCVECARAYKQTESYKRQHAAYLRRVERKRYASDPDYAERQRQRVRKALWKRRGIDVTEEEYQRLHALQDGRCRICNERSHGRRLAVDHDHATGVIRGLLCTDCNVALGRFKDDINRLTAAIAYLMSAP